MKGRRDGISMSAWKSNMDSGLPAVCRLNQNKENIQGHEANRARRVGTSQQKACDFWPSGCLGGLESFELMPGGIRASIRFGLIRQKYSRALNGSLAVEFLVEAWSSFGLF